MGFILGSVEAWKLGRDLAEGRRKEDLKGVCGRTRYKGRNEKNRGRGKEVMGG